jgi:hypothetical protein
VTAAHIHRGAVGVNGPIVHFLSATGFTQVSGSITLSEADVADLRAGLFYANVHSVTHPGGFARGQMYLTPADAYRGAAQGLIDAWNRRDAAGFLDRLTDNGAMDLFDAPKSEVAQFLPEFIGDPPIRFVGATNVVASDRSLTGILDLAMGIALERSQTGFILDGIWKLDNATELLAPIPSGTTGVDLSLQDFAFVYNRAAITSGNIGFNITNAGPQPHEVVLARLDADVDLLEAIQSEEEPEGVEVVAQAGPWDAGERASLVFTQPLSAGRYALLCFIEDPASGLPHVALGMLSEFNVGGAGGTVRPPSTGDGGLLPTEDGSLLRFAGLAVTLASFGLLVGLRLRAL